MSALDELLLSLASAPSLPGARCRGRHRLFDGGRPGEDSESLQARHAQALGLCAMCPALDRCTSWLESLPKRQRLLGVVAGRRYTTEGEVPPGSGCDSTAAAVDAVLEQLATLAEDRGDR